MATQFYYGKTLHSLLLVLVMLLIASGIGCHKFPTTQQEKIDWFWSGIDV